MICKHGLVPTLATTLLGIPFVSAHASNPAIQPVVLVVEGDVVPGVGIVTRIDGLAVGPSGGWRIEVDTDQVNTDSDAVVLQDGILTFQEGQPIVAPGAPTISSFDSLSLNAAGHGVWNLFLDTGSTSNDSGLFWDAKLILQEGTISSAAGFSPGTPYIGFFETKQNAVHQMIVVASVDDPVITSTVDRALILFQLDASGNSLGEFVVAMEGDILPGQTFPVADFGTGPHTFALSDNSDVLYFADTTDATTSDGNIYRNYTLLAREGTNSPVAGRTWLSLGSSRMDLSPNGAHYVFQGQLSAPTADDQLIVRDGAKFIQEGDTLPPIAPFTFTSFGSAALRVSNDGDVFWIGDWNDPDTTKDVGLFLNHELLVQEGVTTINGLVVESLSTVESNFAISPDGRYIVFEATLAGGLNGAFRIDRGPWTDAGGGIASTASNPRLMGSGSLQVGSPVTLSLTGALPNVPTTLLLGASAINVQTLGGLIVPSPNVVISGLQSDANGSLQLSSTWPPGAHPGFLIFAQYLYPDAATLAGVAGSNAILGTVP